MIFAWLALGLAVTTSAQQQVEYVSPLGKTFYARVVRPELLGEMERKLAEAESPELLLEVGQEFAAYRLYGRAIEIFSRGIESKPDWAPLYRHRGHRYISIRDFESAKRDLQQAARLDGESVEIQFHLALAYYFAGDFALARDSFRRCLDLVTTDDDRAATSYWLYFTLRRLKDEDDAQALLDTIHAEMRVEQSAPYLELLLFHKGLVPEADVLTEDATERQLATFGYGVACRYLFEGNERKAHELFRKIIAGRWWPAFGFIAAEVELIRAGE